MKTEDLKSTCYLVLEPVYSRYGSREVVGFKAVRVMQRAPKGAFSLQLDLTVPKEVFQLRQIVAEIKAEKEDIQVSVQTRKAIGRKGTTWGHRCRHVLHSGACLILLLSFRKLKHIK